MAQLTDRDIELLSTYLDGELERAESVQLEARLQAEPELRQMLAELRWVSDGMKKLPLKSPPRRYWLTPDMVGQRAPSWRMPALRWATAALALALVTVIGLDFLGSAGTLGMAGAPQALEAPALAQDSLPADQAMTEKTEANTEQAFESQAGAVEGTPPANALRAAAPTPEAGLGSGETTQMAQALPQTDASGSSLETPAPLAQAPLNNTELASSGELSSSPPSALRWSELLLGACLILLVAIQIRNRR